jgi:hypothetical protein
MWGSFNDILLLTGKINSIFQDHIIQITENMNVQKIHYCFTLSEEQMKFLRSKKYKIDRMECFMSLVSLAERDTKLVQVSKTQQVEILRGQFMVDNTQLAKLWDKDRKTVPKLLEAMESLGISSSQKVGENRIHTLHSLSGWYVDGTLVTNPFDLKRNADGSAIFHAEVPPVRVITIESEDIPKESKNTNKDSRVTDGNFSSDTVEVKTSSVYDSMSHLSSQSNDSADEGKSGSDDNSSILSSNPSSSRSDSPYNSADNPSSSEGADGKQNGGKRNEGASYKSEEHAAQLYGNSGGSNAPHGSYHPNDYHQ